MLNESDPLHIILSTGLCIKSEHLATRKNYTQNELKLNHDVHGTCQHLVCNLYVFIGVFEFWLQTLLLQQEGHLYHFLRQEYELIQISIRTKLRKHRLQVRPSLEPII